MSHSETDPSTIFFSGIGILTGILLLLLVKAIPAVDNFVSFLIAFFNESYTYFAKQKPLFLFLWSSITTIGIMFVLMLLAVFISFIINYIFEFVRRWVLNAFKLDIGFFFTLVKLPGLFMKQAIISITAKIVGLNVGTAFSMKSNGDTSSLFLKQTPDKQWSAILVAMSPLLNAMFLLGLLMFNTHTLEFLLDPASIFLLNNLRIYLAFSLLAGGLPNSEHVVYIIQTYISLSPWTAPLIIWGLIAAWFTYIALGSFWASFLFLSYLIMVFWYDLRKEEQSDEITQEDLELLVNIDEDTEY